MAIYTERFLHHQAAGAWAFTVPASKRAVITHIDVLSQIAGSGHINLAVGPIFATLILLPVPDVAHHETMKIVAYQGELVVLTISHSGIHCNVDGYLFDDDSGRTGPPAQVKHFPLGTTMPAIAAELGGA